MMDIEDLVSIKAKQMYADFYEYSNGHVGSSLCEFVKVSNTKEICYLAIKNIKDAFKLYGDTLGEIEFWNEVKEEIENL